MAKAKKMIKKKLSPAERSQVAKDRWAKIRAAKVAQDKPTIPSPEQVYGAIMEEVPQVINEMLVADAKTGRDENGVPPVVGLGDGTITPNGTFIPSSSPVPPEITVAPVVNLVPAPAPQLAPAKAPKQKRYTGPKEFSVALKAAENRLAKAIVERAQAAGSLAALNAEIPSLLGIINALKGSGNYVPPVAYDPNATAFQMPAPPQFQPVVDPMDAIRAAMAAPPVSRAVGNAVQLPPDVVGTLEGPDDEDPDKFITGPHAGGGWIGA